MFVLLASILANIVLIYVGHGTLKKVKEHAFTTTGCRRSGESTSLPPMWPGLGVTYGLSLLVLYSAPRGFFPGTPVVPSPKTNL